MILYELKCSSDHAFEAWFRDSATYEQQAADGDVACPYCGDTTVRKAPMAPNIASSKGEDVTPAEPGENRARQVAEQILEAVDRLRRHVEDECDYVGNQFAEEARRIHYGESDDRGIYGEASEDEVKDLDDEGVQFYRLPTGIRKND